MKEYDRAVIVGRSLTNYKLCRHSIEPGFRVLPCRVCNAKVAISPDGIAMLEKYSQLDPIVMCNECAFVVVPTNADLRMTKNAADQLDRGDEAKPVLDQFLNKFGVKNG